MPSEAQNKNTNAVKSAAKRRKYNSPVRQQQSAETRESIIAAGSALVHEFTTWDWTNLTAKAVGEQAGVSERTVRRYFPSERKLRDAVLERLVKESGLALDQLELENFADAVAVLFRYLRSFAVEKTTAQDPAFEALDKERVKMLKAAIARATPDWSSEHQESVCAMLDILWQPELYDRLTKTWGFDTDHAIAVIARLVRIIEQAIREDNPKEFLS